MFLAHQLEIQELRKPFIRGAATCGSIVQLPTLQLNSASLLVIAMR
jgi:hypothetical protein